MDCDEMIVPYGQENRNLSSGFTDSDAISRHADDGRKTVAIVEDERDIVDIYCKICTAKGLRIAFVAYDGVEALETFKRSVSPDVILIDHRMPNMTGLEAMKRMLEIDPYARFILLSADENVRSDALNARAKAFIKKPAHISEILDTITRVLGEP